MRKFLILSFISFFISDQSFAFRHTGYVKPAAEAFVADADDPVSKKGGLDRQIRQKEKELRIEQLKKRELERQSKFTEKQISVKENEIRLEQKKFTKQKNAATKAIVTKEKEIKNAQVSLTNLNKQEKASKAKISAIEKKLQFEKEQDKTDINVIKELTSQLQSEKSRLDKLSNQKSFVEKRISAAKQDLKIEQQKLSQQQKRSENAIFKIGKEIQVQKEELKNFQKLKAEIDESIALKIQELDALMGGNWSGGNGDGSGNASIPIDGGLSFLLLGGLGFGAYQVRKNRHKA